MSVELIISYCYERTGPDKILLVAGKEFLLSYSSFYSAHVIDCNATNSKVPQVPEHDEFSLNSSLLKSKLTLISPLYSNSCIIKYIHRQAVTKNGFTRFPEFVRYCVRELYRKENSLRLVDWLCLVSYPPDIALLELNTLYSLSSCIRCYRVLLAPGRSVSISTDFPRAICDRSPPYVIKVARTLYLHQDSMNSD